MKSLKNDLHASFKHLAKHLIWYITWNWELLNFWFPTLNWRKNSLQRSVKTLPCAGSAVQQHMEATFPTFFFNHLSLCSSHLLIYNHRLDWPIRDLSLCVCIVGGFMCVSLCGYVCLFVPIFGTKLLIVAERERVTTAQRTVACKIFL